MKYQFIADFLSSAIGLEPLSLGETGLNHAIESLMKIMGCDNELDLLKKFKSDRECFDRLVMVMTVPETWFFREPQSFVVLEELAKNFHAKHPADKFRILSMACCTGEEPYSAAMTLLAAGLPENSFQIDAFDINVFSLEAAKRGIYQSKSFRASSKSFDSFKERFFYPGTEAGQFILDPKVITHVNFSQGNLTEPSTMPSLQKYDVIFCRNVIIYLNAQSRESVVDYIRNSLVDGGTLFLGPSEIVTSDYFKPLKHPHSFGYEFTARPAPKPQEKFAPHQPSEKTPIRRIKIGTEETKAQLQKSHHWNLPTHVDTLPHDPMERARTLADMGKLKEASDICSDFIDRNVTTPSPSAFYLMGVINEAQGKHDTAWQFFQKALYLQADHLESLQYLWLLARHKGDAATASNMQRRMQRVIERRKEHSVK